MEQQEPEHGEAVEHVPALPSNGFWYRNFSDARCYWDEGCARLAEATTDRLNDLEAVRALGNAILRDHSALYLNVKNSRPLFRLMDRLEDVDEVSIHVLAAMLFLVGQQKTEAFEEIEAAIQQDSQSHALRALRASIASSIPGHSADDIVNTYSEAIRLADSCAFPESRFQYHYQRARNIIDRHCIRTPVGISLDEPLSLETFRQQQGALNDLVAFLANEPIDHPNVCHAHWSLCVLYCQWARHFGAAPRPTTATPADEQLLAPVTAWDHLWTGCTLENLSTSNIPNAAVAPVAATSATAAAAASTTPAGMIFFTEAARHHRFGLASLRAHRTVAQKDVNYVSPVGMEDALREATVMMQRTAALFGLSSPPATITALETRMAEEAAAAPQPPPATRVPAAAAPAPISVPTPSPPAAPKPGSTPGESPDID
ncbi:hypothetical protein PAPYR_1752 [Paratrimastix pyriformis]|uniref:Uncharacterized protein n=1 Tax=Paratrimastix pyriformis TaxID=342808 RepID=A0ABQ8UR89_9EUKA|nr:hypothetical protein PAPYR_1752 [Paratrimastix pyriformis]